MLPLPPQETALPRPMVAAAARVQVSVTPDTTIDSEFNITKDDMAMVYMLITICTQLPNAFGDAICVSTVKVLLEKTFIIAKTC